MGKDASAEVIALDVAVSMVGAALAKARELKLKPMTVAVLDAGGHIIALHREDLASILRPQLAVGKGATALNLGISSRALANMAQERPQFVASLGPMSGGTIVPSAGGLLIQNAAGRVIGAIGVTGDTPDNDETCALAGIAAGGLSAVQ